MIKMLYTEFINKAMQETITQADNGLWYLEPLWQLVLHDNGLYFNQISDFQTEPQEVENILKLEVKRRNTVNSKKPAIINWLYELITEQIEPAMLQEETDFIKQILKFMDANRENQKLDQEQWNNFKNT